MSDGDERLAEATAELRRIVARIFGAAVAEEPTLWEQGEQLTEEQKADLADVMLATAERVRFTRDHAALMEAASQWEGQSGQADRRWAWLPLNRKERYYTGTVLPMLVASDGFAHLHRFINLCGLPDVEIEASLSRAHEITFFTEYGFKESVFTDADRQAWPDLVEGDTPDIVIAGPDWLLAVEAKMFHNPSGRALEAQMGRQKNLVDYWAGTRNLEPSRVRHVLLLPQPLAERVGSLAYPVVTWEMVLEAYDRVAPRYWARVLAVALASHSALVSRLGSGRNADDVLTGQEVIEAHADGSAQFDQVGRRGGLNGAALLQDLDTGAWRYTRYEVRKGALPGNKNWFSLADFVAATASTTPTEE